MTPEELRGRTFDFCRRVIRFTGPLLQRLETSDIARQLRRAAASVASNYRAAGRARSHREFTARIGVVREEADEALHWLALLHECSLAEGPELAVLASEAEEFVRIFVRSYLTAQNRERRGQQPTNSRRSG